MGAKDLRPAAPATDAPSAEGLRSASVPADKPEPPPRLATISHEALFAGNGPTRCDACRRPLDDDAGEPPEYALRGRGVYLWHRGGETRFEDAPLCPACASAIGMTALARWEIEEEEG